MNHPAVVKNSCRPAAPSKSWQRKQRNSEARPSRLFLDSSTPLRFARNDTLNMHHLGHPAYNDAKTLG